MKIENRKTTGRIAYLGPAHDVNNDDFCIFTQSEHLGPDIQLPYRVVVVIVFLLSVQRPNVRASCTQRLGITRDAGSYNCDAQYRNEKGQTQPKDSGPVGRKENHSHYSYAIWEGERDLIPFARLLLIPKETLGMRKLGKRSERTSIDLATLH